MVKKYTSTTNTTSSLLSSQQYCIDNDVTIAIECLQKAILKRINKYNTYKKRQRYDNDEQSVVVVAQVLPKSITTVLQQIQYCISYLKQHVQSLYTLIQCFITKLHTHFLQQLKDLLLEQQNQNEQTKNIQLLFQSIFLYIVRIQDGIIYCVSGECRHSGDIDRYKQITSSKKFDLVSNLVESTQSSYNKNNIYSATSWDEYMDPTIGLYYQCLVQIKHYTSSSSTSTSSTSKHSPLSTLIETVWDKLDITATTLLDNIINTIEIQMKECKDTIIKFWKTTFLSDIKRLLSSVSSSKSSLSTSTVSSSPAVQLQLTDKLEKLYVSFTSTHNNKKVSFTLERYGSDFQIHSKDGVLPIQHITVTDWWNNYITMHMPKCSNNNDRTFKNTALVVPTKTKKEQQQQQQQQNQKRRMVIDDDSSNDDENDNIQTKSKVLNNQDPAPATTGTTTTNGIVVRVQNKTTTTTTDTNNTKSIIAIKEQLGINSTVLQASREIVEAEEYGTEKAAAIIDADTTNNMITNYEYDNNETDNQINDDDETTANAHDTIIRITIYEQRIKHWKRIIHREEQKYTAANKSNQQDDDYISTTTVWDAYENLRQTCMEIGNIYLWFQIPQRTTSRCINKKYERTNCIQLAIKYFQSCIDIVQIQQQLHTKMNTTTGSNDKTTAAVASTDISNSLFIERNLLLLHIRATINTGIGYIELGKVSSTTDTHNDVFERRARTKYNTRNTSDSNNCNIMYYKNSIEYTNKAFDLITKVKQSIDKCFAVQTNPISYSQHRELALDNYQTIQLESLALRWQGVATWYLQNKSIHKITTAANNDESYQLLFEKAGSVMNTAVNDYSHSDIFNDEEVIEGEIECYIECYYAYTQIADLYMEQLEQQQRLKQQKLDHNVMKAILSKALKRAASISTIIHERISYINNNNNENNNDHNSTRFYQMLHEKDIRRPEIVLETLKEIIAQLNETKLQSRTTTSSTGNTVQSTTTIGNTRNNNYSGMQQQNTNVPRGDLFSSTVQSANSLPTRLYTVQEGRRGGRHEQHQQQNKIQSHQSSNFSNKTKVKRNSNNTTTCRYGGNATISSSNNNPKQQQKYFKWGDDLLPKQIVNEITGESKPIVVYPAIAPPMPNEIRDMLAKYQQQQLQLQLQQRQVQ